MAEAAAPADLKKMTAEALRRLKAPRAEKAQFDPLFREVFSFAMPYRIYQTSDGPTSQKTMNSDMNDKFASTAPQVTADFASYIADTFTPEHTRWAGVETTASVAAIAAANGIDEDELRQELEREIKSDTDAVFDAIEASNFYDQVKQGDRDLSVSSFGLTIEDPGFGQPFRCQVVPLTELLIGRGAGGGVTTRFSERMISFDDLDELFPGIALPGKVAEKRRKNKNGKVKLSQGCWRDFSDPGRHRWHVITMLEDDAIAYQRTDGEGSAPMQVFRWDPDPCFAFGIGPGLKALADFREEDEIRYLHLKGAARAIDPPVAYDDDSIINLEAGLTNGVAIARMKGSKIDVIESGANFDFSIFSINDIQSRIRRHYYLDQPEQPGKTPPTATQWTDEALRQMRRLATPAAPMWSESLSEVYMRFRYLLVRRGVLSPDIRVKGQVFQLRPVNPLKIAAQQVEAIATERFFNVIGQIFGPQLALASIKPGSTVHKFRALLNASGVDVKEADDIDKAVEAFLQMQMASSVAQTASAVGIGIDPTGGAG